jgi:hypothetical protein
VWAGSGKLHVGGGVFDVIQRARATNGLQNLLYTGRRTGLVNCSAAQRHADEVSWLCEFWLLLLGDGVADPRNAVGLEVNDPVAVEMTLKDGLAEPHDQRTGFLGKEATDGNRVVHDQVVSGVAFGADNLLVQLRVKTGLGQLGHGIVPGADCGERQ